MKRPTGILTGLALLLIVATASSAAAQVKSATVRVDGLSCPFCAYSLEKHLKKVEGAGEVKIEVNKGIAELISRPDESLEVEQLNDAVVKAGFTPRGTTITAVGHVGDLAGAIAFHIIGTDMTLVFEKNAQFDRLEKALGNQMKTVKITGQVHKDIQVGHGSHPFTLAVESYEITEGS